MKRNTLLKIALIFGLIISLIMIKCTDALKDVQITVNSDVFKYTSLIDITSSSGASMDDATVTISGTDAAKIYNMDGYQDFKVNGGIVTFAVDPNNTPNENDPVEFNVTIKKSGYSTVNIPVVITAKDSSSLQYIVMVDNANPPAGVTSKSNTINIDDGKVSGDTTIVVGSGTVEDGATTIDLKAGTQFKDAGGTVFGSLTEVKTTTLTVDAASNDGLAVFPGGSLTQNAVKTEGGSSAAGTLFPAGLTEVTMTANGQEVKGFTTPVQINLQLNPDFVNPSTNQVIKVGDELKVYSYSADNGYWQYENTAAVVNKEGHLMVTITTSHLTWFMAGSFNSACGSNLSLKVKADWLVNGVTTPVTFKLYSTKDGNSTPDKVISTTTITAKDGDTVVVKNTPSIPVVVKAYDILGNEIYSKSIGSPCGSDIQEVVLIKSIATNNAKTTMQLYVRCPNNTKPINVLPTFYLYFKLAGSSNSNYKLVGKVINGYISTTLLDVNKRYDFKAVWGNTVKIVLDKSVSADNTATVGDNQQAGELIGTKAGATNLEILKEKCNEL